jgi:hypothetical protein
MSVGGQTGCAGGQTGCTGGQTGCTTCGTLDGQTWFIVRGPQVAHGPAPTGGVTIVVGQGGHGAVHAHIGIPAQVRRLKTVHPCDT